MNVYHSIKDFRKPRHAVVTIGTFDGVHRGHQKIIDRLNDLARAAGGESVVLTFEPHPRMVLHPDDHGLMLLNTPEEKVALMERYGVGHLIVYPFSIAFSRTSVTEYVRDLLVNAIGTRTLVIGYDHHFGRNREGSLKDLMELSPLYGFGVEEIPEQDIRHVAVSSTKIRESLLAGDVRTANEFLGHPYTLTGTVVAGDRRGRELGFPTANLAVAERYKLIPGNGIYAVKAAVEGDSGEYNGAMSIGTRPTFDDGDVIPEVYLIGFDGDLYGRRLKVTFRERLREERSFPTAAALEAQMKDDVKEALRLLSS